MKKCSYCGDKTKLTKEHIIPKGFIKKMDTKNRITFSDKSDERVTKGELLIKDVCQKCNNGELSILDSYALTLISELNKNISSNETEILFKYDYNLLVRWLLKIFYNSARANNSNFDITLYKKNLDYILGLGEPKTNISAFALYMNNPISINNNKEFEIDSFRIARFKLVETHTFNCASKCLLVNSFAFLIVLCDHEHSDELSKIKETIAESKVNFIELSSANEAILSQDKSFYKESLKINAHLRDSFLEKRTKKFNKDFIILSLTKADIESQDLFKVESTVSETLLTKDDLMDSYQKLIITFDGYESENREIYQIKSFQNYIRNIFDNFPEIIWTLSLNSSVSSIKIMLLAYVNARHIDNPYENITNVIVDQELLTKLLASFFHSINNITNIYAFDKSKNDDLTKKIIDIFSDVFNS
ncbi:MAG: hypothetical protein ACRC4T_28095 [Cetobacterium sp.]